MPYSPDKAAKMELKVSQKAGKALRSAYRRTLDAGLTVLIVEEGKLVEVSPDSDRKEIRSVAPSVKVVKGKTYKITRPPEN